MDGSVDAATGVGVATGGGVASGVDVTNADASFCAFVEPGAVSAPGASTGDGATVPATDPSPPDVACFTEVDSAAAPPAAPEPDAASAGVDPLASEAVEVSVLDVAASDDPAETTVLPPAPAPAPAPLLPPLIPSPVRIPVGRSCAPNGEPDRSADGVAPPAVGDAVDVDVPVVAGDRTQDGALDVKPVDGCGEGDAAVPPVVDRSGVAPRRNGDDETLELDDPASLAGAGDAAVPLGDSPAR